MKSRGEGETGGVAGMITWEQLRELAAFRAQHVSAVSLYMGLDPSIVPTAGDLASHTRSMLARAERLADESADVPGRHDQGGWSQSNYERHIETIVDRHLRDVAVALDRCVRRLRDVRVVLAGPEETRSGFEALLAPETRGALVGWVPAEAHVGPPRLLEAARPLLDEWRAGREEELLARWREEAARNGRAAVGWEETLQAASDGRVELLLVQDGADRPAYVCPECGRAQAEDGSCPLDGTNLQTADA